MHRFLIALISLILFSPSIMSANHTQDIKVIYTTDVHGNFFPYDYITLSPAQGSLARIKSAIDSLRDANGDEAIVLLDNGDILQGQPTVYYFNYIDTQSPHIASEIYDYMKYDAVTIGNHDIETGHNVYDRVRQQTHTPILGANVIDRTTKKPYFEPYTVIEKNGIKIAVLGLLTPAIPAWLPENLWAGMEFEDMEDSARRWIPAIKERENPDIIIGLFHSGHDASKMTGDYIENASVEVARNIPGFDIVLMGHDHQRYLDTITDISGNSVHLLNPANNAMAVGVVNISVTRDGDGNIISKKIDSEIADISYFKPSPDFMARFSSEELKVRDFVTRKIGTVTETLSTQDAYFGPSSFMSLLHRLQLKISGADISFAAPLSYDAEIRKGDLHVSDMFTLYKYENMLYTMELTGQEIKDYLEEAYSLWTRQITDKQKHLINFYNEKPSYSDNRFRYPTYNFDSAAGINYTVDVTGPKGEKIRIHEMSSGAPFDLDKKYLVAINSYRGNGGGDLLTKGAGIPHSELSRRIVRSTEKDLRYYLLKTIEEEGTVRPETDFNWHFIPEDIAAKAAAIDRELLFSPKSQKNQK